MFVKEVESGKASLEIELQNIAAKHGFSPKILNVEGAGERTRIYMENLEAEPLAVEYGDQPEDTPEWIWNEIRRMITFLYEEEGIEYVDITPYNFIEKDGKVYIIDFGDAKYHEKETDWFLAEFLEGENSWNPDYK